MPHIVFPQHDKDRIHDEKDDERKRETGNITDGPDRLRAAELDNDKGNHCSRNSPHKSEPARGQIIRTGLNSRHLGCRKGTGIHRGCKKDEGNEKQNHHKESGQGKGTDERDNGPGFVTLFQKSGYIDGAAHLRFDRKVSEGSHCGPAPQSAQDELAEGDLAERPALGDPGVEHAHERHIHKIAGPVAEGPALHKASASVGIGEGAQADDVLKKQTQKNTDNKIQNVLTNSATQGIVCQTEYFDKQIANNENTSGYYIVKPGYFVYNPRISVSAPCGPFNRYNGDKDGIMSPLYSVYCFCDKSITYANFLTYYFSSSKWYAYMNSIANYGARSDRMNVTGEDMNNMPIPYPPLPEQPKLSLFSQHKTRLSSVMKRR